MTEVICVLKNKCTSHPHKCKTCLLNKGRKDHYTPIYIPPRTHPFPYVPRPFPPKDKYPRWKRDYPWSTCVRPSWKNPNTYRRF